jgi:hypothetical protein
MLLGARFPNSQKSANNDIGYTGGDKKNVQRGDQASEK